MIFLIIIIAYCIYAFTASIFGYIQNKRRINNTYKNYIKGLCCCLELQYRPAMSKREIDKYEYFFTYSVDGMLYKTSRYHCNNDFCNNGDTIEIYVNPFDFEDVFIPKFDDESDELVMAVIKGSVIHMIEFILCAMALFQII